VIEVKHQARTTATFKSSCIDCTVITNEYRGGGRGDLKMPSKRSARQAEELIDP